MKTDMFVWFLTFIVILVIVCPFITIWAVNTLFNTNIPMNIWTYLATLWLTGLVTGSSGIRSK
jgi:hypothetical protein